MLDKMLYIFALIVAIVIGVMVISALFWVIYQSIKYVPPSVRQNGGLPRRKVNKCNKKTECRK
jgi:hypothetical protein